MIPKDWLQIPDVTEALEDFIRTAVDQKVSEFLQMWESDPTTAPWNLPPHLLEDRIQRLYLSELQNRSILDKVISQRDTVSPTTEEPSDVDTVHTPHLTQVSQRVLGVLTEAESSHVERCYLCAVYTVVLQSQLAMRAQDVAGDTSTLVRPESLPYAASHTQAKGLDVITSTVLPSPSRDFTEAEVSCAAARHEPNDWGLIMIDGFPHIRCYKHDGGDYYMLMENGDTTLPMVVTKTRNQQK